MNDSFVRLVGMLALLGKEDIGYGGVQLFKRKQFVKISPSFFRGYECKQCGYCCKNVSLEWLACDFPERLVNDLNTQVLFSPIINGNQPVIVRRILSPQSATKCRYLIDNACSIHDCSPFSCRFELFRVRETKDSGILTMQKSGRSWIVREGTTAQCKIVPMTESFLDQAILYLGELGKFADDLQVKTWIPEIVEFLSTVKFPTFPKEMMVIGENKI
jgi:Fe-S-cluster containining protein